LWRLDGTPLGQRLGALGARTARSRVGPARTLQ
jgi:hypothetical protein